MRSEYKDLGLELVSLEDKISRTPNRPLMEGEKKHDRMGDPFKLLIEEALTQQRNEMMDNLRKSFGDYQQAMHLLRAEAPPPSRYK
jgi:hypothetical protein